MTIAQKAMHVMIAAEERFVSDPHGDGDSYVSMEVDLERLADKEGLTLDQLYCLVDNEIRRI